MWLSTGVLVGVGVGACRTNVAVPHVPGDGNVVRIVVASTMTLPGSVLDALTAVYPSRICHWTMRK